MGIDVPPSFHGHGATYVPPLAYQVTLILKRRMTATLLVLAMAQTIPGQLLLPLRRMCKHVLHPEAAKCSDHGTVQ